MSGLPADSHTYELVAHDEEDQHEEDNGGEDVSKPKRPRIPFLWRIELFFKKYPKTFFMSCLILGIIVYSIAIGPFSFFRKPSECDSIAAGYQCRPEISHNWGQYSPYYTVPSEISLEIPETCEVTFVQVLSRHGARDPTRSRTIQYSGLIKSLHAVVDEFKGRYAFLNDYQYTLGADQLTAFGQQQMYRSGVKFYRRYKHLAVNWKPFIRASGQQRVIDSAHFFTQGYEEACRNDTNGSPSAACLQSPFPYVEISEEPGSHNPLDHGLCDAFEDAHRVGIAKQHTDTWRDIFAAPIAARLNKDLPDAGLDNEEIVLLMELCPFESAARIDGKLSPFCDLFTAKEFKQYDYLTALGKWYEFASYDNLGPTQGVGFTNELIARLTGKPVIDRTSVDHELDGDQKTFPFGSDWRIYADFSHDNDMLMILSAMGVFNSTEPLSDTTMKPDYANEFSTSRLVPFGARIYFEKMVCHKPGTKESEDYIRVIINDRVQPMKSCKADELGRCTLSEFVGSLEYARTGGRWDDCFEKA